MPRSCSAKTVPCAITKKVRSLASRASHHKQDPRRDRRRHRALHRGQRKASPRSRPAVSYGPRHRPAFRPLRPQARKSVASRRRRTRLRSRLLPELANRRVIEALGLEQPAYCCNMLLTLLEAAAPGERLQQDFVYPLIEGSKVRAIARDSPKRLVVRRRLDEYSSNSAVRQARKRRRCATSQLLKAGLRSISTSSRTSPLKSEASSRSRSIGSEARPCCTACATCAVSTRQSEISRLTVSPLVSSRYFPLPIGRFVDNGSHLADTSGDTVSLDISDCLVDTAAGCTGSRAGPGLAADRAGCVNSPHFSAAKFWKTSISIAVPPSTIGWLRSGAASAPGARRC